MYPELKQGMRRPQDRYAWTNSMRPKGPVTMPYWMIFVHSISCGTCHNMQVGNISLMRNRLDRSESPGITAARRCPHHAASCTGQLTTYCFTQTSADSSSSHSWPIGRHGGKRSWLDGTEKSSPTRKHVRNSFRKSTPLDIPQQLGWVAKDCRGHSNREDNACVALAIRGKPASCIESWWKKTTSVSQSIDSG